MEIVLTNLAARYYAKHGWTLDILTGYLTKGGFAAKDLGETGEYYLLDVGGSIDVDRLLKDYPGIKVSCFHKENADAQCKSLLESRNW